MISYKTILSAWDKFFFTERPTEGIALFRILWMSLIFLYFLCELHNIHDFFGPHAILSLQTVKENFPALHLNLFHRFDTGYAIIYTFATIFGISIITSIIGLHTRLSLTVAFVMMVSFHQRNIWLLCSSEVLMRIVMLFLIFAPSGNSLSLDSLMARAKNMPLPKKGSVWALRLIQIQISVMYIWTVWHKLKGNDWVDGTAVYYATRLEEMKNFSLPYVLDSIWFLKLSTWGTIVLELALGTLIWVKEFRKPLILLGIGFHIGIEYLMSIPFFELNLIILLINFYTPEELRDFVYRAAYKFRETPSQIVNGSQVLQFVRAEMREEG